ncbi:4207_t:CDS:2, partial [Gigaspora rosea]
MISSPAFEIPHGWKEVFGIYRSPRIRIRFDLENARIFSEALREQLQRCNFEGLSQKVDRTP